MGNGLTFEIWLEAASLPPYDLDEVPEPFVGPPVERLPFLRRADPARADAR